MSRRPLIRDSQEELIEEIRRLNQSLSDVGSGEVDASQTFNIEGEQGADLSGDPEYVTSGLSGVGVTNEDWEDIDLGRPVRTVNLRFSNAIDVAFNNPHERGSWRIPLRADESPFTIGGDVPVKADTIWIKKGQYLTLEEGQSRDDVTPRLDFIVMR